MSLVTNGRIESNFGNENPIIGHAKKVFQSCFRGFVRVLENIVQC